MAVIKKQSKLVNGQNEKVKKKSAKNKDVKTRHAISGSQVRENKNDASRPYNADWERQKDFTGWLAKAPASVFIKNKREAFCKWCKTGLRAHKSDLDAHKATIRHQKRATELNCTQQKQLSQCGVTKKSDASISKKLDISLVLHVACHSSLTAIDHLCETLKRLGSGTLFEKLQLHRTKASKLMLNIISPSFLKELVDDLGEGCFSIIVDESTDVSCCKYMAYAVKYFSERSQKIVTNFLGFSRVTSATAEQLHLDFLKFLLDAGLNIKKMVGIGTDGASNMCGKHNSPFALLKRDEPLLQLIKCMCHSINNSASTAANELPSAVEFLIKQSKNYFSHSSQRLERFEALYKTMNEAKAPLRLVALSTTRWLAFSSAVSVILRQWNELREFFAEAAITTDRKSTDVQILAESYKKCDNLLYLQLVDNVLRDVTALNVAFQKSNANITVLHDDLRTSILSLARRIFKPASLKPIICEANPSLTALHQADLDAVRKALEKADDEFGNSLLPVDVVDYGLKFSEYAEKCIANKTITAQDLKIVKQRARAYILRLVKELVKRLPHNLEVIEKINYFTPAVCLAQVRSVSVRDLPWELADDTIDRNEVESQWRKLQTFRLTDISPEFTGNESPEQFWVVARRMENNNEQRRFLDLANFGLRAMILPTSNPDIERIFSVMAIVKNKLRNRMLLPMLVAIIRIRVHLRVYGLCCRDYEPTSHLLALFNSQVYGKTDMEKDEPEEEHHLTLQALELDGADEMFDLLARFGVNCIHPPLND